VFQTPIGKSQEVAILPKMIQRGGCHGHKKNISQQHHGWGGKEKPKQNPNTLG